MKELDERIREALAQEDAEILKHQVADAPLYEQLIGIYQGRLRWLNFGATIGTFAIFGAIIFCGYRFFQADDTQAMIGWATAFLWSVVWMAMMKIWFWMEMQKNSVTREVKRLELLLVGYMESQSKKRESG